MPKVPHVALLIESSRAYGRGILQGVIRYLRDHGAWSIYFETGGLNALPPQWFKRWHGDGILARIDNRATARIVTRMGIPAVDLRLYIPRLGLPAVGADNTQEVRMAFEHLADRGFRRFGFCGTPRGTNNWMDFREKIFHAAASEAGFTCISFDAVKVGARTDWERRQGLLAAWLLQLPKPIAIMACNDEYGQHVLDACRRAGILVPEELAVIGIGNDEVLCNLSSPPLSSVDPDPERIGYEAAALLDGLMAGQPAPKSPVLLPPRGVVSRQSTDVLAIEDKSMAAVVRHIREHACEGLRLKEILKRFPFSRRQLERRMLDLLGRSPKQEITRVQIEKAKELLQETDLTAEAIAERCGFSQAKYFSQVFHEKVGLPPGAYRRLKSRSSR